MTPGGGGEFLIPGHSADLYIFFFGDRVVRRGARGHLFFLQTIVK